MIVDYHCIGAGRISWVFHAPLDTEATFSRSFLCWLIVWTHRLRSNISENKSLNWISTKVEDWSYIIDEKLLDVKKISSKQKGNKQREREMIRHNFNFKSHRSVKFICSIFIRDDSWASYGYYWVKDVVNVFCETFPADNSLM